MWEVIKTSGEAALVASGLPAVRRRLYRHGRLILAYHNVVPDGWSPSGDVSLHLRVGDFAQQLDELVQTHRVVSLVQLLKAYPLTDDHYDRPSIAITFDDAYRGAVTLGIRELVRRDLPATLFVVPRFVGREPFWWDRLARGRNGADFEQLRRKALEEWGGAQQLILRRAHELGLEESSVDSNLEPATEAELRDAARFPGITLGSHSWSHPDLRALEPPELEQELRMSLAWLQERFESVIPWLSYPYGTYSAAVESAAMKVGYRAAVRIDGGWFGRSRQTSFSLPRLNIPAGLSRRGFVLRTAGLFCR